MTFLLGRQAIFGHEPPMYLRSITATCCPCLASVHARYLDPSPLPRITRSYFSMTPVGCNPTDGVGSWTGFMSAPELLRANAAWSFFPLNNIPTPGTLYEREV